MITLRRIQEVIVGAEIIDATGDEDPVDLPASTFEIAPFVVPLLIGQPQARRIRANGQRRRSRSRGTLADGPLRPASEDTALTQVSAAAPVRRAPPTTPRLPR